MKLLPQFSKIDHLILRGMFCCKNIHAKEQDFIEASLKLKLVSFYLSGKFFLGTIT